jgi:hypothetical protein
MILRLSGFSGGLLATLINLKPVQDHGDDQDGCNGS